MPSEDTQVKAGRLIVAAKLGDGAKPVQELDAVLKRSGMGERARRRVKAEMVETSQEPEGWVARLRPGAREEMSAAASLERIDETLTGVLPCRPQEFSEAAHAVGLFGHDVAAAKRRLGIVTRRVKGEWTVERLAVEELPGVGDCPERPEGLGHVWESWRVHENRPCKFCGQWGRRNPITQPLYDSNGERTEHQQGYLELVTAERGKAFMDLRTPESAKGVKPKEA